MSRARTFMLVVCCVAAVLVAPWIGPGMFSEWAAGAPALDLEARQFIWANLRVPRVGMGLLVGACLGATGAAYQVVFSNPLATPSTVGTSAGATLGALGVLVLSSGGQAVGVPLLVLAAFIGAVGATAVAAAVSASGRASAEDVLLAGIAVTLATSALASGLQFQADYAETFAAVRWSLGNLAVVGAQRPLMLLPLALINLAIILWFRRSLEALVVGPERAQTQGISVVAVRTWCLVAGALGVGASVALCGPIAFVGLIVPHLVRRFTGASRASIMWMSALGGGALLVLCDAIARVAWPGREIPVGVITAALGAPSLLWLIVRRRRAAA